ncbi:MAG: MMPL family transporter, partial [Planctomycetota bacterium]
MTSPSPPASDRHRDSASRHLLARRSPLRVSYATLILFGFFFLLPFAFRAARVAVNEKANDVKDWLPADFRETAELSWFADHFAGESFVIATWPGCQADDQRLKLLYQKLRHESAQYDPSSQYDDATVGKIQRAREIGKQHGLMLTGDLHTNWGGKNEKWLMDDRGGWYYIVPDGTLYRWEEAQTGPSAAIRAFRQARGSYELKGQAITALGRESSDGDPSLFYKDPSLIAQPLFSSVATGPTLAAELAKEGGPLWPLDFTDPAMRQTIADRRAMDRLTGILFAPAVPEGFAWTADAIFEKLAAADREVDAAARTKIAAELDRILQTQFDGDPERLGAATTIQQSQVWYAVLDAAQVEAPERLTALLITLSEVGKKHLAAGLGRGVMGMPRGRLHHLADSSGLTAALPPSMAPPPFNVTVPEQVGNAPPLRLGGPPVDNMAIDEEGTVTLFRLVGYSLLLGVLLSYVCFRSIKITIMVFVVGGSAALLSMALVRWTGGRVDAILMSMPSLVYVLGLSGAIHVINYYRDEVRDHGAPGAATRALKHALMPCTLASLTTAIGLISLYTSNLAPISNFGLYAAIGVIATLAILFSYLPAALQSFPPRLRELEQAAASDSKRADESTSNESTSNESTSSESTSNEPTTPRQEDDGLLTRLWIATGRVIAKHHVLATCGCLLLLVASAYGLKDLKTSVQLLKLFDGNSRILRDYAWLEENFGKLVPMEVIVRMPTEIQAEYASSSSTANDDSGTGNDDSDAVDEAIDPTQLPLLERVEAIARVRAVIEKTLGESGRGVVGVATSADTLLPPLPAPSRRYSPTRTVFNDDLVKSLDTLRTTDYLRLENGGPFDDSELWRISLRVAALSDVDYGQFIGTLHAAVAPVMRAYEVRREILQSAMKRDGPVSKASILMLGRETPPVIADAEMLDSDGHLDQEAIYFSALEEIFRGEKVGKVRWMEIDDQRIEKLDDPSKMGRWLDQFDTIVVVGPHAVDPALLDAGRVVQALAPEDFVAADHPPKMLPGGVPTVAGDPPIMAIFTGVVPVIYKAQRTLLTSLTESIAMAFVLIAIVMVVLLNPGRRGWSVFKPANLGYGFAAGAVSMIPNVFPVLLVFGLLCHAGVAID